MMRVVNHSNKSGREAVRRLNRYLDDRFTLVHHVRLSGHKNAIDAVLVGPHGVTVLAWVGEEEGRVRCLGDNWYVWYLKVQDFVKADHSPAKQVRSDRTAIEAFLAGRQMGTTIPIDCAVLAPHAGVQVEFMDPAVPILPALKIAGFARGLAGQRELLEWTQADDVLKNLGVQPLGKPWHTLNQPGARTQSVRPSRLGGLKRWQVILLAVMAVADLAILIGGLAIVLMR
jgi:hypothetical protein